MASHRPPTLHRLQRDCVIVMAKQPVAGRAKTRLAAAIGADTALRLAWAFLDDTLVLVRELPARVLLSYTPPEARALFAQRLPPNAFLHAQPEGDLGVRLAAAFRCAFAVGAGRAIVIATDSPSLPPGYLVDALAALRRHEVVIGPADDGGYYLLGLTRLLPSLFEGIAWSTERVFAQTLARCAELGIAPYVLAPWYDVDDAAGLARLETDLRAAPARC